MLTIPLYFLLIVLNIEDCGLEVTFVAATFYVFAKDICPLFEFVPPVFGFNDGFVLAYIVCTF